MTLTLTFLGLKLELSLGRAHEDTGGVEEPGGYEDLGPAEPRAPLAAPGEWLTSGRPAGFTAPLPSLWPAEYEEVEEE